MSIDRRTVLLSGAAAAGAAAAGVSVTFLAGASEVRGLLRPPGALAEKEFLAACIKCGQCIQVCPYHSLKLLDLRAGIDMGTPAVDARERGCYLCDLFPCILCCPSGALDAEVQKIEEVAMGTAWVHEPRKCLAIDAKPVPDEWFDEIMAHGGSTELENDLRTRLKPLKGEPCRLCEVVCPVPEREKAIRISGGVPVIGDKCVGCGACAEVCPPGIIEIKARKTYSELYKPERK